MARQHCGCKDAEPRRGAVGGAEDGDGARLRDTAPSAVPPGATPGTAPLGTPTKFHSASRAERFALQAVARDLLPDERVRFCLRSRRPDQPGISVWRSVEHGRAHFQGLQVCGSVWHCPVCAAKISERRRAELSAAIAVHRAAGGDVALLTLTNSHHVGHRLRELLDGQEKALKRFRGDRASRALFDSMGVVGFVRALEVTHGANGWHPHYHLLVFLRRPLRSLVEFRDQLATRWVDCCRAAGLPLPSLERGVDLRGGTWAAKYAAKWGIEQEMTKSHVKRGRLKGSSPFDLLRQAMDAGEVEPCELFREFAKTFKGKAQLMWSRGLKAALGVQEVSDQELVQQPEESAVLLGQISSYAWQTILRLQLRARVLDAADDGPEALRAFLMNLPAAFPPVAAAQKEGCNRG